MKIAEAEKFPDGALKGERGRKTRRPQHNNTSQIKMITSYEHREETESYCTAPEEFGCVCSWGLRSFDLQWAGG